MRGNDQLGGGPVSKWANFALNFIVWDVRGLINNSYFHSILLGIKQTFLPLLFREFYSAFDSPNG